MRQTYSVRAMEPVPDRWKIGNPDLWPIFAPEMNDHTSTIQRFRWVALLEGLSFLVLLFIAMPLKYWADLPLLVKYVGWAHGVLFISYIVLAVPLFTRVKWPMDRIYGVGIASLLPFGTFVMERRWLR